MNDEAVVFPMALGLLHRWTRPAGRPTVLRATALALVGVSLCACVSLPRNPYGPLPVDLTSPVAADIRSLDLKSTPYPSFLQVPGQPTDVRPVTAWNRNIFDMLAERRQSQALVIVFPQTLYGAEAFAQEARSQVAPPLTAIEAAGQADKSAAFAQTGRARAKAPSPAP